MTDNKKAQGWLGKYVAALVLVPVVLLLLPALAIRGLAYLAYSAVLHGAAWLRHGRFVAYVYSDSPKWKDHVETHVLPALPADAIVINRSRPWRKRSLAGRAYRHFGGEHEYCPIGIVIERGKRVRRFRFFTPYLSAMKGDDAALLSTYAAFMAAVQRGH